MKPTLTLLAALLLAPLAALHAAEPSSLKTEFLENPLGIDTAKPRFSWIVEDATLGAKQTAYQLQAASSPEKLAQGEADLWDSGKVSSEQSNLVEYAGQPLVSRQQVWWRVKTWDKEGKEGRWSPAGSFAVGLLAEADWKAQWIKAPLKPENNDAAQAWVRMATVPLVPDNLLNHTGKAMALPTPEETQQAEAKNAGRLEQLAPCPLLRKEFTAKGAIRKARAYVAAPGFFELHINGKKVGDRELEPGVTPFREQVLYSVHDITPLLSEGPNALGLILGHGWFASSHIGYCMPTGTTPVVRAEFEIEYQDGSKEVIATDGSWKYAAGPILKDSHWLGECYDARREIAGWNQAGFDDSAWKNSEVTKSPTKRLDPDLVPPERVVRRVNAKKLYSPAEGVWVYDMGEAFSGAAELKVNVPAGTTLTMRYTQTLFADHKKGSLLRYDSSEWKERVPGMIAPHISMGVSGGFASGWIYQVFTPTDVYVAKGGGEEVWRRRFGYTAYRYVELTGYPGKPPEDAVTGVVVHTDLPREGSFSSSNELLNKIYTAVVNTFLYCTHGVTQDNPTREKQFSPYAPGVTYATGAGFSSPVVGTTWTRIVDASILTQDIYGKFDPLGGFRENYESLLQESFSFRLAYELWLRFGDDRPLRRSLDGFAAYLDYYLNNPENRRSKVYPGTELAAPDLSKGLLRGGMYTQDWGDSSSVAGLPPEKVNFPPMEKQRLMWGTGFLCENIDWFVAMARQAGREDLAVKYSTLLEAVRAEMRKSLYNETTGSYGSQGNDALALTAGVARPEDRTQVVKAIVNDIAKLGGRFTTGTLGFPRTLAVLSENGQGDVAYQLVTREDYPSLAKLLENDNGTFSEFWGETRAGCMIQSERCSMGFWFTEWVAGIRPDPAHPGYKHFLLGSIFPAKLDSARAEVLSPYGKIASAWKREGDQIRWNVTIPWNTSATVKLPGFSGISVNGKPQDKSEFNLPAGQWEIVSNSNQLPK